ncbi:DUF378 domain-containing protein [Alkalibacillus sp. S2W]|uniref:DUF378 domain-containing protein n=1 Tax=Alkalibacillus TaxID=331654 RepID=UPI0014218196|nr:DUF378 domain-containing protein [Alkalibacillus almallahensis]NIK11708.1 hypothetical protein [Alkalibacillus almallahensis]
MRKTALILLIIGGLNWLLVGLFEWDLLGGLFGGMDEFIPRLVYIIVGLAALYALSFVDKVDHE